MPAPTGLFVSVGAGTGGSAAAMDAEDNPTVVSNSSAAM